MTTGLALGLGIALAGAFAAILLGRNLTYSIVSVLAGLAALAFVLVRAGAGFLALSVVLLAALVLATVQLIGWMLVDIDRDHLPPTDRGTLLARSLAFALVGLGLALLLGVAGAGGELAAVEGAVSAALPAEVGRLVFADFRPIAWLLGLALAAGLLAALLLLRRDGARD